MLKPLENFECRQNINASATQTNIGAAKSKQLTYSFTKHKRIWIMWLILSFSTLKDHHHKWIRRVIVVESWMNYGMYSSIERWYFRSERFRVTNLSCWQAQKYILDGKIHSAFFLSFLAASKNEITVLTSISLDTFVLFQQKGHPIFIYNHNNNIYFDISLLFHTGGLFICV